MLGLEPGSVTPLGALNDAGHRVEVVLDQELVDAGRVTVHPCDNTATVLLATTDLIGLLQKHGCTGRVLDLARDPKGDCPLLNHQVVPLA